MENGTSRVRHVWSGGASSLFASSGRRNSFCRVSTADFDVKDVAVRTRSTVNVRTNLFRSWQWGGNSYPVDEEEKDEALGVGNSRR